MRWLQLVAICAVAATAFGSPEPKKYKSEVKAKEKADPTLLTDEERKFLREVETKFGVKTEVPLENSEEDGEDLKETDDSTPMKQSFKPPFPAVIAIEIVNDTDTKTKGKRTIDANLGYGYRTNSGYSYSYFGKPSQEKGKFMIYPYSQEDIPPAHHNSHSGYSQPSHGYKSSKFRPSVEITPSKAYELVPQEEEDNSYHYDKPANPLKTKYEEAIESIQSPPSSYPESSAENPRSSTLYTTYNGKDFSSLSGQFPQVMPNYLVDPSQLVNSPQYQSAGLTQEHLRSHGGNLEQRVVPVLVLRIPSSYIKNPSAELYANLPQNYPFSQYLNHLNLQQLVNEYFRKIGFSYAPRVMAYQRPAVESHVSAPVSHYEPQQYASPYVQPSYTNADHSGVQYSAVQPVMARYPAGYTQQQLYTSQGPSLYRPPHQKYLYMYRYVPPAAAQQSHYTQPQYQQQASYQSAAEQPRQHEVQEITIHQQTGKIEYGTPQPETNEHEHSDSAQYSNGGHSQETQEYEHAPTAAPQYESSPSATPEYEHTTPASYEYGPTKAYLDQSIQIQYGQSQPQKETIAVFHRGQTGHNYNVPNFHASQDSYEVQNVANEHYENSGNENYQNEGNEHYQNAGNQHSAEDLVLHENYPSKDHTIATVLPQSYQAKMHNDAVQSVSYVTPEPTMKYHSKFRVMVPQTVLTKPSENVAYVNSQSISQSSYSQYSSKGHNPEEEYTTGQHYVPPVGKQRASSHPYNYHAHLKRMARPESKVENTSSSSPRKEKSAKKKST